MIEPDFRALCSELVNKIDYTWGDIPDDVIALMDRTRAALAESYESEASNPPEGHPDPEPFQAILGERAATLLQQQAQPVEGPTDDQTTPDRLRQCPTHGQQPPNAWGCPECVRDLRESLENLRHIAARHVDETTRADAALAQPVEGPTDEAIDRVVSQAISTYIESDTESLVVNERRLYRVMSRAILARWGQRPAVAPVPLSERLPGEVDCCGNPRNGEGQWCWGRVRPQTAAGTPVVWRLMRIDCLIDEAVEWLPWWAIPLPPSNNQPGGFNAYWHRAWKYPDTGALADVIRDAAGQLKLDPEVNSSGGAVISCQEQLHRIADKLEERQPIIT